MKRIFSILIPVVFLIFGFSLDASADALSECEAKYAPQFEAWGALGGSAYLEVIGKCVDSYNSYSVQQYYVPTGIYSSGSCSWHGGVNCSAGADYDGSTICIDGWRDSNVLYLNVEKCKSTYDANARDIWEIYMDLIEIYTIEIDIKVNELLIGGLIQDEASELIDYIWDKKKEARAQRDQVSSWVNSGDSLLELQASYIYEDYATFVGQADEIIDSIEVYLKKLEDICIYGLYDVPSNTCNCDTGYVWSDTLDRCTSGTNFCQNIFGPYAKYDKLNNICICKDGYEQNIRGTCLLIKEDAVNNTTTSTASTITSNVTTNTNETIFNDIDTNYEYLNAIMYLKRADIIGGYPDGSFQPNKTLNRAELLKILVGESLPEGDYSNCFNDVKDEWFAPYVCYAKEQGWVEGYAGNVFRPAQEVVKAEAIKMAVEVFGIELPQQITTDPYPSVEKNSWYGKYVFVAKEAGLYDSDVSDFIPHLDMQRGEVSDVIYRLIALKKLSMSVYSKSLDSEMSNY